ncbi:MAG TPA: hypothetical protein VIH69_07980 [Dehalococcoidia bacterium]
MRNIFVLHVARALGYWFLRRHFYLFGTLNLFLGWHFRQTLHTYDINMIEVKSSHLTLFALRQNDVL